MIFFQKNCHPIVLALGAHEDDIELGSSGTLSRLIQLYDAVVYFAIMTCCGSPAKGEAPKDNRAREALSAMKVLLEKEDNETALQHLRFGNFNDCCLYSAGHALIRYIERLIETIKPNVIFVNSPKDFHLDHESTARAVISAARCFHGSIIFYQGPSTIPNEFAPTIFVQLGQREFDKKLDMLRCHRSQRAKDFMSYSRILKMAQAWSAFHRMNGDVRLEAFELYKSFWI